MGRDGESVAWSACVPPDRQVGYEKDLCVETSEGECVANRNFNTIKRARNTRCAPPKASLLGMLLSTSAGDCLRSYGEHRKASGEAGMGGDSGYARSLGMAKR